MARYLVLDIGGTFIKYAIMDEEANFILQDKVPAQTSSEEEMLQSLRELKSEVGDDYEGVAISMPGRIDTKAGIAHTGGAFTWLNEYPAAEKYGAIFGKPTTIANDGKCAASAESWEGALKDVNSGAVLVLGTGVGGGISSRAIWAGKIAAGGIVPAFAKRKGLPQADGVMLFDAYAEGDPDAVAVLEEYAVWASSGIITLQAVLDLERYAIGGGISARPEATTLIRDAVDKLFDMHPGLPFSKPEIVTCKFGNEANLIGALAFHLKNN